MIGMGNSWLASVLAVSLMGTMACAPVGDVLGDVQGTTLYGEVRSLDTRRGVLQVREDYGGRTETVRVDNRTRVLYRQRQYPVSSLERGDQVRIRVARDRDGSRRANEIEVRESVRDTRAGNSIQRLDGTVVQVDGRRRAFALQPNRSTTYVVHVPARVSRDDARRFDRLRRGDRARVDVRLLGRGEAELVRFR